MERNMIKMKQLFITSILTIAFTGTSYAGNSEWIEAKAEDNMSMMEYAGKNHDRLSAKAVSVSIDPNFSSWAALWTYEMPDGKVVKCTRGMIGNTFMYECKEY
jgi:hypothetical protein